jgi:Zn-dependent M28 family amino/carboxypeptidase
VAAAPVARAAVAASGAGAASITPEDIHRRVAFLASDALRGRHTPSPGLDSAAAYLAREHQRIGLRPGGEGGGFYQRYPLRTVALDTTSVHFGTVLADGTANEMLSYGEDFFALPGGGVSGQDMNHGQLVYVGRLGESGLPRREYRGAVPVVAIPGALSRAWLSEVLRARAAAREAGATAVVVVAEAGFSPTAFRQIAATSRTEQSTAVGVGDQEEIAVFALTDRAFRGIAARQGDVFDRAEQGPVALDKLDAHFAAQTQVIQDSRPPNVVAVLEGSDPQLRNEYVILSAHMDHVGVGEPVNGDSIYNGADDDASGTAALVEVAEALASVPERPRRSVIFLHVSGEELGLLGSHWYSENPTVPLERVVANINVDMIGRNSPDTVVVIGKNYSSLGTTANAVQGRHPELGLTLSDDIWPEEQFFFRSDHFNFARKEIPSLFFFSGVHEDYHRPSDHLEKLDLDKAARISRMIFYLVQEIANDPSRPQWDPAGLAEVRALTQ